MVLPSTHLSIVYCPFPDRESAVTVARILVNEGLAACVQCLPPIESIYRWQGQVEQAIEVPLLAKVAPGKSIGARARIAELHPYDLPAVVSWSADCAPDLADWADGQAA